MNDFWSSDLGEITGNAADAFVRTFKQIPDGTFALAKIDNFTNVDHQGFKYLLIEWLLVDGDFKGQKVQQKLKVFGGDKFDKDPAKTKHRALNMFKLLFQLFNMKPKHAGAPTDHDLAVFIGKIAGIKIRETEPNDEGKQYNWVSEVHESQGFKSETGMPLVATHTKAPEQATFDSAFSRNSAPVVPYDDIPF